MSPEVKVSKAAQAIARALDRSLKNIAGERMGFVLLVVPFGRAGLNTTYLANMPTPDAQGVMREFIARHGDDVPLHDQVEADTARKH